MAAYASVTFIARMQDSLAPRWRQEATITERVIPYANYDDVQSAGRRNFKLEVEATLTAAADVSTMQAAVGITLRTLTNIFGDSVNYTNVALLSMGPVLKVPGQNYWFVSLVFTRQGA